MSDIMKCTRCFPADDIPQSCEDCRFNCGIRNWETPGHPCGQFRCWYGCGVCKNNCGPCNIKKEV